MRVRRVEAKANRNVTRPRPFLFAVRYTLDMKVIIERHPDGFVAYPLGLRGVVVGQGDTYEAALADVNSAIRFHIETFGREVVDDDSEVLEVYVDEARVA